MKRLWGAAGHKRVRSSGRGTSKAGHSAFDPAFLFQISLWESEGIVVSSMFRGGLAETYRLAMRMLSNQVIKRCSSGGMIEMNFGFDIAINSDPQTVETLEPAHSLRQMCVF